jgi:hypothetical protein
MHPSADVFTARRADEHVTELAVAGGNDPRGVVVRVLPEEPAGDDESRALVAFVEPLRGRDLVRECRSGIDRIALDSCSRERALHPVKLVVVGARRDLVAFPHCLVARDELVEGGEPHRSRR